MGLIELLQIGPYSALYLPGLGGELAISFASIGHDDSRAPSPEFMATASGRGTSAAPRSALFIQDESRSWASDGHFPTILTESLKLIPAAEKIVTLGMSMGGFSALAAATIVPLHAVLAFVPQYSMDADIVPEDRWQKWRPQKPLPYPTCPLPQPPCHAYIFHAGQDDAAHYEKFPRPKNCDHLLCETLSHSDLVPHLKGKGLLSGLLQAAFAEDRRRLLRIASTIGAKRMRPDT